MSIFERVFFNIEAVKRYPALIYSGRSISYVELFNSIISMKERLQSENMYPGERVLVLLPNCPEFIISFFAITQAEGVAVLADYRLNDEIIQIINENDIKIIVTDAYGAEKISKLKNGYDLGTSSESTLVLSDTIEIQTGKSKSTVKSLQLSQPLDMPAMIFYSSGSTSKAKAVVHSHNTLIADMQNYVTSLGISSDDRFVAVSSLSHSYALGSCMLAGLSAGATLLIQDKFHPKNVYKLISSAKATIFQGVPFMYGLLNSFFSKNKPDISSMKYFISAGAPLPQNIAETFHSHFNKTIHQQYGTSETGTISINLSEDVQSNIDSVGKPLKNVEARIVNQTEDAGSIQIKSPALALGYLGEEPFDREWFSTGDLGKLDERSNIYITGREKRIISVAGLKVNPFEIENHLQSYSGVKEALIKGSSHEKYGEIIEAYIVCENNNLSTNDIINYCREHLAPYKVPTRVYFVDSLDKTISGKIKY